MRSAWLLTYLFAVAQPPAQFHPAGQSNEPPLAIDDGIQQVGGQAPAPARPNTPPPANAVPVVAVRVEAPKVAPVGMQIAYRIHVENRSPAPALDVSLVGTLTPGCKVVKADPPGQAADGKITWPLGTLAAGKAQTIAVFVEAPPAAKDVNLDAVVRFAHGQSTRTHLTTPALALKAAAPPKTQQFDIVTLRLELANTGQLPVDEVYLTCTLTDGLALFDPLAAKPTTDGKRQWPIGRLAPGQVRVIDFYAQTRAVGSIPFSAEVTAANGLKTGAGGTVVVEAPKLEVTAEAPSHRTAHQAAPVKITVKNAGPGVLRNVVVSDFISPGLVVESIQNGGLELDGQVQWIVPTLAPGAAQVLGLTTRAPRGGRAEHRVTAVYRGMRSDAAAATTFEAVPDVSWDLIGQPAALAVGETVIYRATLTNKGAAATDARLTFTLPAGLEYVNAIPAHRADGPAIRFEPRPLPAGEVTEYTLTARAAKAVGRVAVVAELAAAGIPGSPLKRSEPTTVVAP